MIYRHEYSLLDIPRLSGERPVMTDRRRHLPPLHRARMPQAADWSLLVPRSSGDTGPSARIRRLVFARAFGCCESCGSSVIGRPYSIQPRVARDAGGISRAEANALWNFSLLCGSADRPRGCHRLCEQRDQGLHDRGIWLWSWENPRLVPVQLCDQQGPRHPAWLTDEGTYDFEGPAGGIGVRSPLKSRVAVL